MGRASIGYLDKDYESLRQELLSRIPQLTQRWTDLNRSDLGVVLLELFCGIGDMLAYYIDAQTAEAFLPTARQRQSIIDLCSLIGYKLDTPIAATVDLEFTLDSPLPQDLVIPSGTVCRAQLDEGTADFETAEDGIIPYGTTSTVVGARQGVRKSMTFDATGVPFLLLRIGEESIAQGSVRVVIDDILWQQVDHFQDSDFDSMHFLVDTDALDFTTVRFGDGAFGAVPRTGAVIFIDWLETLGEKGNIGPALVNEIPSPIEIGGVPVSIAVSNPAPATGGAYSESIEHARKQASAELRSLWKAVTIEDYKALAEGYPGVAKAQVLDTNDCTNIRYYNVHIAVAPNGGGLPSAQLKRELTAFFETRKVITVEVRLFDPMYRNVNIDANVYHWPNECPELVRSRVVSRLADMFAFSNVTFGQAIHPSDIVSLLDGTRGVSHVELFVPHQDLLLHKGEIPVLGLVDLTMRKADR